MWSDTPERYKEARIIFKDFESSNWTWDPVAKAYYWHRFYSHQPDLNFDNPEVRAAMLNAVDFWLDMGVDGLRLDAVPYLYEREGTNCENLPETHAFLQRAAARTSTSAIAARCCWRRRTSGRRTPSPISATGDECHMAFHFPLMPRLFMATRMEDRYPVTEILQLTPPIPENCQWALFLRNHDELTLEMVTDEERDYMYRVYAQDRHMRINLGIRRRLAPLLENDRRRIELMNALLFSLPGTPVIYYGDEIGMGDNFYLGDRNGVRTPMQWSARPQRRILARQSAAALPAGEHRSGVPLRSDQRGDAAEQSALAAVVDEAAAGAAQAVARHGPRQSLEFLYPGEPARAGVRATATKRSACWWWRTSRGSRSARNWICPQYQGMAPLELFGKTEFPADRATGRTFCRWAPHAFYWFALQPQGGAEETLRIRTGEPPTIAVESLGRRLHRLGARDAEPHAAVRSCAAGAGSAGRTGPIRLAEIHEVVPFPQVAVVHAAGAGGVHGGRPGVLYAAAVASADGHEREFPSSAGATASAGRRDGSALQRAAQSRVLRRTAGARSCGGADFTGSAASWWPSHTRPFGRSGARTVRRWSLRVARADQDNTTVFLWRPVRAEALPQSGGGAASRAGDRRAADAGRISQRGAAGGSGGIPRSGRRADGDRGAARISCAGRVERWQYMLDHLGMFYEHALARGHAGPTAERNVHWSATDGSPAAGIRAAAGHAHRRSCTLALAARPEDPVFAPEPFTDFYRHGLYHGMLARLGRTMEAAARPIGAAAGDGAGGRRTRCSSGRALLREQLRFMRDHADRWRRASAFTATITWGRRCIPARIS